MQRVLGGYSSYFKSLISCWMLQRKWLSDLVLLWFFILLCLLSALELLAFFVAQILHINYIVEGHECTCSSYFVLIDSLCFVFSCHCFYKCSINSLFAKHMGCTYSCWGIEQVPCSIVQWYWANLMLGPHCWLASMIGKQYSFLLYHCRVTIYFNSYVFTLMFLALPSFMCLHSW